MRNLSLTYDDLFNEIDYAIENELNLNFIVKGNVAENIYGYLECEHDMPQFEELGDRLDEFDHSKVYIIDILSNDDFIYFVQEAYYKGVLLENDEEFTDISYVDSESDLSLSDMKRVHGKQVVVFDLEEDDYELCECCDCEDEENYALNLLLDRIENLEREVAELKEAKSKDRYVIDDIEVSKVAYEKFYDSFNKQWKEIANSFAKMDKFW